MLMGKTTCKCEVNRKYMIGCLPKILLGEKSKLVVHGPSEFFGRDPNFGRLDRCTLPALLC